MVIGSRSQSRSRVMVYLHRAGVSSQFWSPAVRSAASITYSGQLNPALLSNFPEQRNFNLGGCCNRYLKTGAMEAASHYGLGGLEPVR